VAQRANAKALARTLVSLRCKLGFRLVQTQITLQFNSSSDILLNTEMSKTRG